ncbi:hypothetical protein V1524DRAFT_257665 [Lipomyces starkeyi]
MLTPTILTNGSLRSLVLRQIAIVPFVLLENHSRRTINMQLMVALYASTYPTAHTMSNGQVIRGGQQSQLIAFSNDKGLTWTKYNGKPVIPSPPYQYATQHNQFRDLFVFWHTPSSKWTTVACLAMTQILLVYS